jgi:hypothetical protein
MGHLSLGTCHWLLVAGHWSFAIGHWFGRTGETGYFLQKVSTIEILSIPDRDPGRLNG